MEKPCTACRSVLGSLTRRHTPDACPLRKTLYCGVCASYGHGPSSCPDTAILALRQPQYLEQLLAPTFLEQYNITSRTPIPSNEPPSTLENPTWEIQETEDALRIELQNVGLKPMICQEKGKKGLKELKENKRRLQQYANENGIKLVFLGSKIPVAAAAGKKSTSKVNATPS
jgi:hypothetical protein